MINKTDSRLTSAPHGFPEILAPAGSAESLIAAIRSGADAVYLGGGGFNARKNADNFDSTALKEAVALCHSHGVRVHFTLNTMIREEEMDRALTLAQEVCRLGVDAIIIQDLGLARRIHAAAPDMPLHASTQISCHSPSGVRQLAELGFSRVVLSREMSREEISACVGQGAELEMFVHGALCMCVSGQCALSAMLGGRSGNRGLCAQPCRLPFMPTHENDLPTAENTALSLKDLCLYPYMDDLKALGIDSLKIEGRMKRPEYVAAATSSYVAARDLPNAEESCSSLFEDLQSVFSRSGFTDGYFTNRRGSAMFGSRRKEDVTAAAPVLGRLARLYDKERANIPVHMEFRMREGEPITLTVCDEDHHCKTVAGECPEKAMNRPLDIARAVGQLQKTGGTPFRATVNCEIGDGLTVPLSSLNALRREALDSLLEERGTSAPILFDISRAPQKTEIPLTSTADFFRRTDSFRRIARFANISQIPENPDADLLILPLSSSESCIRRWSARIPVGVEIPRALFGMEESIKQALQTAASAGAQVALCGNIGAIPLAREYGLLPLAGFGMNAANSDTLSALQSCGVGAAVCSQELTFGQLRFALRSPLPTGILAYGRQPLMLMRNCPYKAASGCASCKGQGSLTDRKGVRFPIACSGGAAELLNSVPLFLADKLDDIPSLDFLLLHFTDESSEQVSEILQAYNSKKSLPSVMPASYTRGLYRRGVE